MASNYNRRSYLKRTGATGLAAISLSGCLGLGGSDSSTVSIGGLISLSGAFASFGEPYREGAEFAVEKLNEEGELDQELELNVTDIETSPQSAVSAYEQFASEDTTATIGPVDTNIGTQLGPRVDELEVPLINHFASAREVLSEDLSYQYRGVTAPGFSEWKAISQIIADGGWSKVGAIFADYSYGLNQKAGFEEFVEPLDGVETHTEVASASTSDFSSVLRRMPDDIDLMATLGHPPGAVTIANQQFNVGLDPDNTIGAHLPDTWWFNSLDKQQVVDGLLEIRGMDPEATKYQDVAKEFNEENDAYFDSFHVNGYATVEAIHEAVKQAGSADSVDVGNALAEGEFETTWCFNLDWTDYGEHTQWTNAIVEYEDGPGEANPNGVAHPVTRSILDPVNPSELESY